MLWSWKTLELKLAREKYENHVHEFNTLHKIQAPAEYKMLTVKKVHPQNTNTVQYFKPYDYNKLYQTGLERWLRR